MADQPRPKSPPVYVDLYGKRRQQAKLQVLEREIGFLKEELKSLETVQPTSRCCKEINEFVATKPDPFITVNQKSDSPDCSWRKIRKKFCFKSSWICCFSGCCQSDNAHHAQVKNNCCCCCTRKLCSTECCGSECCSCLNQNCCSFKLTCSSNCCKVKLCPNSVRSCCSSCCW